MENASAVPPSGMIPPGQRAAVSHPVYPVAASPDRLETLNRTVAPLLAVSEAELVTLVPDRTGFRFMGCPNCDAGSHESDLGWSIDDPCHVRCPHCRMAFPNETYPEEGVLRIRNAVGKVQEYPYWADETGYRYLFSAKAWRQTRVYLAARAEDLGILYQVTGERTYARRAALILDTFARYYPGFLIAHDRAYQQKGFILEPPYPNHSGKWGRWRADEMPTNLVLAYDSIYESGELERLSDEAGLDVKARIENDFFMGAVRQDGYHGPVYSNVSGRIYRGYAVIGRVLGYPGLVHEAVRRSRHLFQTEFFLDGFWREGTPGYHRGTLERMQPALDALKGYADPPGYVHPDDGERFDDLDLERDLGMAVRAKRVRDLCRYPDGRMMPIHDTNGRFDGYGGDIRQPDRSASILFTGMGHAWLGRGVGGNQAQVHLHFSGGYGHDHADSLNLMLFAEGQELLSDVGYTHTRYRPWATSTLCHNTVVIDEKEQHRKGKSGPSDGRLLAFETAHGPVQWLEAGAERAYPGLAEVYRRMVMLVETGGSGVYVVDLFRVVGGSRHDWTLHGSADRDGGATVSVPLKPWGKDLLPGVEVRLPVHEKDSGQAEGRNLNYAFVQHVSRGDVADGVDAHFRTVDSSVGVRTHLSGLDGAMLLLGDAPSVRRADENEAVLDRFRMPVLLVRRDGPPPLTSLFAAVHEPFGEEPSVEEVLVRTLPREPDAVRLQIRCGGFTDHIVHRGGSKNQVYQEGDLCLEGEVGFVRERNGRPEAMGLWGGTELRWGSRRLASARSLAGEVVGALRREDGAPYDALCVTGPVPEGEGLRGAMVITTFADGATLGYRIAGVRRSEESVHLILEEDPGIAVDRGGMRYLFLPHRGVPGPVTYRVRTSVFARLNDGHPEVTSVGEARVEDLRRSTGDRDEAS